MGVWLLLGVVGNLFWPDACSMFGVVGYFTVSLSLACIIRVTDNIRFGTKTLCYLGLLPSQHFQCCALCCKLQ